MRVFSDIYFEIFLKALEKYPPFLKTNDLVSLRLFVDKTQVVNARHEKKTPPYVKKGAFAYYPKDWLIAYVKQAVDRKKE